MYNLDSLQTFEQNNVDVIVPIHTLITHTFLTKVYPDDRYLHTKDGNMIDEFLKPCEHT